MTSGPVVVVADEFDEEQNQAFLEAVPSGSTIVSGLDTSEARDADFIVTWATDLDTIRLDSFSSLRGVVKLDSGPAEVSVDVLAKRDLPFEIASSPALVSVAEHTVMLILALFKRLGPAISRTQERSWGEGIAPILTNQEEYSYNWVGLEKFEAVTGKTIGLVGLGRIGVEVAKLMNAFGCTVVYAKRNQLPKEEESALNVTFLPFDDLLAHSHCVSLHNRFDETTEKLMGVEQFEIMKPGSFFVNTARGRLVDEEALIGALESGHLAGAAIDVAWYEPPLEDSQLWAAPNLLITPHSAGIPIGVSLVEELTKAGQLISSRWAS